MKASEISKGDLLFWRRTGRRSRLGVKAKVLDPSPVYGKTSRYGSQVGKGFGTGVLVEVEEMTGYGSARKVRKVRYAAPLSQLVGPYAATVKRFKAEEKAERDEERKAGREQDRRFAAEQRLVRRLRRVNVHADPAYAKWGGGTVKVSVHALSAMLDALPDGWKAPEVPWDEEDSL